VWKSRSKDVPQRSPRPADRIEPVAHQPRVATRRDAATILGEERTLGDGVQAGEQGQPVVEDVAHDVAVPRGAEELQGQQRPQGRGGGDHGRSGEAAARQDPVQVGRDQVGQEQEQAAELGVQGAGCQIELTDIGHLGGDGTGAIGPLVVAASRQFGEALFLEDRGDGRRAERLALAGQGAADVVDGEVLLAQGDDLFAKPFLLARRSADARRRDEEVARGLMAELMDEDAEAPRCIAEPAGRFGGGETIDEEGPEGFVLPVGGVGGLQEPACQR